MVTATLVFDGQGGVIRYEGNYSDMLLQQQVSADQALESSAPPTVSKKQERKANRPRKGLSYKEKLELEQVEQAIAELEQQQAELEQALSETVNRTVEELEELGHKFARVSEKLTDSYERWEALELKKEGIDETS
jgi:ATP-binding cassette subfamily F protein uup